MKKKILLIVGEVNQTMPQANSTKEFEPKEKDQALAYFWAMRKVIFPQRVWMYQGADGWVNNDQTVGKEPPAHLAGMVAAIVAEDNQIALDGIGSDEVSQAA